MLFVIVCLLVVFVCEFFCLFRYTNYDLVLASNLIDRLYDPRAFLTLIHERVNPGGLLIIASPNSWELEFTRKGGSS